MSFLSVIEQYDNFDFEYYFSTVTAQDVLRSLEKEYLDIFDFLNLLSPTAIKFLDQMANRSKKESLKHFGKVIGLYTPMYISNYCINQCNYCSFNKDNNIRRRQLTPDEIEAEAKAIAKTGLKHILILTGENKKITSIDYLITAVEICKQYFDSIAIEIFPLESDEYQQMINAGVSGLTIYQETYNRNLYDEVHLAGPKKDFEFRLNAPERALQKDINFINIGALLGLDDFRRELFFTGLHGNYLMKNYPFVELSFSLPRIKPIKGQQIISQEAINDQQFLQAMLALKLFMPYAGINLSTRENQELRKTLLPYGVNKMSAGVSTEVGGHTLAQDKSVPQFEISDHRSVKAVEQMIKAQGYQPIKKDWFNL